jgi:hypothetical protein
MHQTITTARSVVSNQTTIIIQSLYLFSSFLSYLKPYNFNTNKSKWSLLPYKSKWSLLAYIPIFIYVTNAVKLTNCFNYPNSFHVVNRTRIEKEQRQEISSIKNSICTTCFCTIFKTYFKSPKNRIYQIIKTYTWRKYYNSQIKQFKNELKFKINIQPPINKICHKIHTIHN